VKGAALLVRAFLVVLLLTTAAAKTLDLPGMATIVDSYRVIPTALTLPAATALALTEVVVGGLLLVPRCRVTGSLASAAMHLTYFVWSAVTLARGLSIANCGCFGTFWARPLSVVTLVEDTVLIVLSLWLARHYRGARG
jgi:hypothetical protein